MPRGWIACALGSAGLLLGGCYYTFEFDTGGPPPLTIVRPPQSTVVTVGQPAAFDVEITGGGDPTYQWLRSGVPIEGALRPTYTTPPVTAADDGSLFTVRVCDATGCLTSLPALLTVLLGP